MLTKIAPVLMLMKNISIYDRIEGGETMLPVRIKVIKLISIPLWRIQKWMKKKRKS